MKKIKGLMAFLAVLIVYSAITSCATSPIGPKWARTYGGTEWEVGPPTIQQTADGGYIMGGLSLSFGDGGGDLWVVKLDASGLVAWQKTYSDQIGMDAARSIKQTTDGGYIVAGNYSAGQEVCDVWVLKLDESGVIEWQKTYGGTEPDYARSIQQTADGYIVAGYTLSFGAGGRDLWVLKLDEYGDIQWQKAYGISELHEGANLIQQTIDGGYIVSGTYSGTLYPAEVIPTEPLWISVGDFWVLKLDANGYIQWQKSFGSHSSDFEQPSIQQTLDGGYITAGTTTSFGAGGGDLWVLKLDANGNIQWQKTYGGSNGEAAYSIQQTLDSGYIVAGRTDSFGVGNGDYWILKLDASGEIEWQKTYGGSLWDAARFIQQTADGYIVTGVTDSFGAGERDLWVLKMDVEGNISDSCPPGIGQATSVVPADTTVVPLDTPATVSDTSCTVTSTSVTPQGTNAIVETQCIDMVTWAKTYGGADDDNLSVMRQTSDGGYIAAGYIDSVFGAEAELQGHCNVGIVKMDYDGAIQWQKNYGFVALSGGSVDISETIDKGYIVTVAHRSLNKIWLLKLAVNGDIEWQRTYGGTEWDEARSIIQATDGSYVLAGFSFSFGTNGDLWIVKLQSNGDSDWERAYGGEGWDIASSLKQTLDGGYIVAGQTSSFGVGGGGDIWVLKLNMYGAIEWQRTYGGTDYDSASSIQQTLDGGYIMAGYTLSFGSGGYDAWVLKLDGFGTVQWQKTYGGTEHDLASSIQQTLDGGYIMAGYTLSFGSGGYDAWVLKLDGFGTVQWQKTYGGTDYDSASSIQQTLDGGYIMGGGTTSFGAGGSDTWFLKLDSNGEISDSCPSGIGQDTSIVPQNTSIVPVDTEASISDTSCTITSTNVTPQDTSITVETQCENQ